MTDLLEEIIVEENTPEFDAMEAHIEADFDMYWNLYSDLEKPFSVELEKFRSYNDSTQEFAGYNETLTNTTDIARWRRSIENSTCPDNLLVTKIVIYFHMEKLEDDAALQSAKALLLKMYVAFTGPTYCISYIWASADIRWVRIIR